MSNEQNEVIKKLISYMEDSLVELFDQLRELRKLLDIPNDEKNSGQKKKLFTSAVTLTEQNISVEKETPADTMRTSISSKPSKAKDMVSTRTTPKSVADSKTTPVASSFKATVSRLLDPIASEIQVGGVPAEIIAEHLQDAKEQLITSTRPNERVARDMGVVLRFLRARGKRSIRPEERDNILLRIQRWKVHLSASSPAH